ncbi:MULTISPECIES: hypothetical protein [Planktothricoides]|uniref:Uncharacterized protein n=1 Tax=Planktothricoides raciborskii GIHE-MW2 TaxID=2792601 RepID=A0AAU8JFQ2_9CYAN|nr:hypothetical protein [Planktothricoides sp. SR001]KOR33662.1 hypothetical protein AM228_28545 [Planktothricoides sp. SR001]
MIPLRPIIETSETHAPNHAIEGTDPLTPEAIGAAAASHTQTGAQISGNISGSAANITGIAAIANGGTGLSTVSAARTNLQVGMSDIPYTFSEG